MLRQAAEWGFVCNEDLQGNSQILPPNPTERWKLQQVDDKWLLLVGNVPQVNLHPHEALAFLKRRVASCSSPENPRISY